MVRFLLAGLVALACVNGNAGGAAAQAVMHQPQSSARLQDILAPMTSLSASFEQVVRDGEGYELQRVTGKLHVARPGKVHWQSDPPYQQLVVSDATTLWLYDPDLEQVTVRPFENDIARTPAVLFIGDVGELAESYKVSSLDVDGGTVYTLVPRDESAIYQKLELGFDNGKPAAMALWDTLGQVTRISFRDVTVNSAPSDDLFRFVVPAGVDVLRDE